jgi:hypothetical protein
MNPCKTEDDWTSKFPEDWLEPISPEPEPEPPTTVERQQELTKYLLQTTISMQDSVTYARSKMANDEETKETISRVLRKIADETNSLLDMLVQLREQICHVNV